MIWDIQKIIVWELHLIWLYCRVNAHHTSIFTLINHSHISLTLILLYSELIQPSFHWDFVVFQKSLCKILKTVRAPFCNISYQHPIPFFFTSLTQTIQNHTHTLLPTYHESQVQSLHGRSHGKIWTKASPVALKYPWLISRLQTKTHEMHVQLCGEEKFSKNAILLFQLFQGHVIVSFLTDSATQSSP